MRVSAGLWVGRLIAWLCWAWVSSGFLQLSHQDSACLLSLFSSPVLHVNRRSGQIGRQVSIFFLRRSWVTEKGSQYYSSVLVLVKINSGLVY